MVKLTREMVVHIRPLVTTLADKWYRRCQLVDREDLIAEGMLAYVECSKRFVASRKVKLSTFAYRRIDGAIRDLQEKYENHSKWVNIEDPENLDAIPIENKLEENHIHRELIYRMIQAMEDKLPDEQALILIRVYFERLSLLAVSRELQAPLPLIKGLHDRALLRLKQILTEDN